MTTTIDATQLCPFCVYYDAEVEPTSAHAKIGNVPACEDCAEIASLCDEGDEMLGWLLERLAQKGWITRQEAESILFMWGEDISVLSDCEMQYIDVNDAGLLSRHSLEVWIECEIKDRGRRIMKAQQEAAR